MNLFIETPQQASTRMAAERRRESDAWLQAVQDEYEAQRAHGAEPDRADDPLSSWGAPDWSEFQRQMQDDGPRFGLGRLLGRRRAKRRAPRPEAAGGAAAAPARPHADPSYSISQESYREELAFHKRRGRRRRLAAVVRALALIVMVPVLLAAIFVGSYVLTCILNGASPEEVATLLGEMATRVTAFARELMA